MQKNKMSSITMAADSTQRDSKSKLNMFKNRNSKKKKARSYSFSSSSTSSSSSSDDDNRRKSRKKRRGNKKKGKSSSRSRTKTKKDRKSSESDCPSDMDLGKILLPIGGYLQDKEMLLTHMLRSISSRKLKDMLPEILKPFSTDELKRMCLDELEGMSRKRIEHLLDGGLPEEISSSDEVSNFGDFETEKSANEKKASVQRRIESDEKTETASKCDGNDGNKALLEDEKKNCDFDEKITSKKDISNEKIEDNKDKEVTEVNKANGDDEVPGNTEFYEIQCYAPELLENEEDDNEEEENHVTTDENITIDDEINENLPEETQMDTGADGEAVGNFGDKTQLEILELEMRARAIKAMLRAQEETEKEARPTSAVKETASSPSHCEGSEEVSKNSNVQGDCAREVFVAESERAISSEGSDDELMTAEAIDADKVNEDTNIQTTTKSTKESTQKNKEVNKNARKVFIPAEIDKARHVSSSQTFKASLHRRIVTYDSAKETPFHSTIPPRTDENDEGGNDVIIEMEN